MDWSQTQILLIGRADSPSIDSARCVLSAAGARIDLVEDPVDALALLTRSRSDYAALALSAADFPADALGPLRAIRQLYPTLAILVFLENGSRRQALQALEAGADAYLPEPFYRRELTALIERVCRRLQGRWEAEVVEVRAAPETTVASETGPAPVPLGVSVVVAGPEPVPAMAPARRPAPTPAEPAPQAEAPAPEEGRPAAPEPTPEEALPVAPAAAAAPPFAPGPETVPERARAAEPEPLEPAPAAAPEPAEPVAESPRTVEQERPEPTGAPTPEPAEAVSTAFLEDAAPREFAPAGVRGRVLLVDSERAFRELLADVLRERGFFVADAADEKQALWCLADSDYDAIVLDARLSGNGLGLRSFHQACPDTPVIVVTNLASPTEQADLRAAGAAACLEKPFDIEQLLMVLAGVTQPRLPSHPVLTREEVDALLAPDTDAEADLEPGSTDPELGY